MIERIEAHYGERCGHIPLNTGQAFLLVKEDSSEEVKQQVAYLSRLFQRDLHAISFTQLARLQQEHAGQKTLIVPYIRVPEADQQVNAALSETEVWGLPPAMVDLLKNKARFYEFAAEIQLPGFALPDYTIASIHNLIAPTLALLKEIEELYQQAGMMGHYPVGVMLRGAESDGNYGCSLLTMEGSHITIVQDGDSLHPISASDWMSALTIAQSHLLSTMNPAKEERIVVSRFLDLEDSPGMSLVLFNGEVASLGWNGQLQLEGSKACVGTSSYLPKNAYLSELQEDGEGITEHFFRACLQQAATKCQVDFKDIRGIANLDIMLPGPLERHLQQRLQRPKLPYLAECNPRWTNYTDAILTVLHASQRIPTVTTMREVIREGIFTIDKHPLPVQLDPMQVRASLSEQDEALDKLGIKIISRMTHNPMGLILTGERVRARQELDRIVNELAKQSIA
jgi:hypothetical protein